MSGRKKKKKTNVVDELLAAPDSTKMSDAEKLKFDQRKAREAALKEQNRRGKLKRKPTVEDMLADIVRVADDEETNPQWKFRTISRKRYVLYGHYPIEHIDTEFGQFNHALEVAGLRDQPGTRMWRSKRAKASRHEHTDRYLKRYVAPYVIDPNSLDFNDDGSYFMLSISDTHSQFLDPFVWFALLSAIKDMKPDCVLMNGDIIEGSEISSHPKIPGWTIPLQDELDFQKEMFRQIRSDAGFGGDLLACFAIDVHHGARAFRKQLAEQAELLVEIVFEARVIIQMVAREIGEGAGGEIYAVEAALLKSMA